MGRRCPSDPIVRTSDCTPQRCRQQTRAMHHSLTNAAAAALSRGCAVPHRSATAPHNSVRVCRRPPPRDPRAHTSGSPAQPPPASDGQSAVFRGVSERAGAHRAPMCAAPTGPPAAPPCPTRKRAAVCAACALSRRRRSRCVCRRPRVRGTRRRAVWWRSRELAAR